MTSFTNIGILTCLFNALALTSVSCAQTSFVSANNPSVQSGTSDAAGDPLKASASNAIEKIESLYRRQKPVAGLAQIKNNFVPAVTVPDIRIPNLLFHIARCDSNVVVSGDFEDFDPNDVSLNSPQSALTYFNRNRFWDDIASKCKEVALVEPQIDFLDISAPSGNWKWYLRACFPSDTHQTVCSQFIYESFALTDYHNNLSERQSVLLNEINQKTLKIRKLSASFPEKARILLTALDECQSSDINNAGKQIMRSILFNLVGIGTSVIFKIFGPAMPQEHSWSKKIALLWQPEDDVQKNGQYVTRILLWLFTQQHDFKQTCTPAEEIRISGIEDVLKLKQLQTELAVRLDEALNLGLPLPPEVMK
jgi:hypothetical protein